MTLVECSPGEIADKVSILKIKMKYLKNPNRTQKELAILEPHVHVDITKLTKVNQLLWDVENEVREHERKKDFGTDFIRLARLVYFTNDERSRIKHSINTECEFGEQKQYVSYTSTSERKKVGILTHMGLGDHLVCNGMIREFNKQYDIITYVKKPYVSSVRHMFRDLEQTVEIVPVENDIDAWNKQHHTTIRSGNFYGPNWDCGNIWCESFYINVGLHPNTLRDEFFYVRSRDDEEKFYRRVVEHLGTDKYIVVHEDLSRYEPLTIQTTLPIVRIGRGQFPVESENIFDYCTVIEKAEEYHGFDSSFAWIVELLKLRPKHTTFMHRLRGYCTPGKNEFTRFETR